ncbi:hypothetical protein JCM10449v2_005266 [Rhodotorula kratochvilovae]
MAILGRSRATSTTPALDPEFGAVKRWGEDFLECFSVEYCREHLDRRATRWKNNKQDWDKLWAYLEQLAIQGDERRAQGDGTEAERVKVLVEQCSAEHIRRQLHLPPFLERSASPEPAPVPETSTNPTHEPPGPMHSLGVEPRLGHRAARAYGTTAARWQAGRAWR